MAKYDESIKLALVSGEGKKRPSKSVVGYLYGGGLDAFATVKYVDDSIAEALGTIENTLNEIVSGGGI